MYGTKDRVSFFYRRIELYEKVLSPGYYCFEFFHFDVFVISDPKTSVYQFLEKQKHFYEKVNAATYVGVTIYWG